LERLVLESKQDMKTQDIARLIAFYLPQYHPIPENDEWWGKGFTDWTNVAKAQPLFPGHYQPHVPAALGYYDLRKPDVMKAQADLARQAGIHGFCYYHYWFNRKVLLETPLHATLESGEPDFPFCLCWANEPWTRAWDGRSGEVLMEQKYSEEDDRDHLRYLAPFFRDRRYIRIDGKPLFLVYRAAHIPDPARAAAVWRDEAVKLGIGEIYLCRVESFNNEHTDPVPLGFDAAVEFQPDWDALGEKSSEPIYGDHSVYSYEDMARRMVVKPHPPYKRFPCVTPSWDNSPRRKKNATIFIESTPQLYEMWLYLALQRSKTCRPEERLVFINAWNEWGEGNHLEPDLKHGTAYLDATRNAINNAEKVSLDADLLKLAGEIASVAYPDFNAWIDGIKKNTGRDDQLPEIFAGVYQAYSRNVIDLAGMRGKLKEEERLLSDRDRQLAERDRQLAERDRQLAERDRQLAERDGALKLMRNSLSWRLTAPLRTIYDLQGVIVNSKRSGYMRTVNEAHKILRSEGFISLLRKSWNRLTAHKQARFKAGLRKDVGSLTFPLAGIPRVSIVIPVYNKVLYTLNCLASILEQTSGVAYEVIVVDDHSVDATAEKLSHMRNLRVLRSEKNRGFVGSCNAGAAEARGEYILFLNNDTAVTPGWLSALVETLDRDPSCGAAGSKLVYPDGTLQEAGGIIWKDASGWNYGKFDDPNKPEYNYVRAVDYCSGAALMVRKALLEKIGGFDKRYSPAYWEDTDLCFTIRKLGYRVLYQPASVVVHYEGVTAGTSTASGMKRYQEINTSKFIEKWSGELSRQYVNDPVNAFLARDRNQGKRILVVDHYVPTHDKDAGSFFMFSLLKALVNLGHRIVFWPENLHRHEPYAGALQQLGIEVVYGRNNFAEYLGKFGKFFDAAVLTRNHIAIHFMDDARKHIPKILYHDPDFEYLREKRRFDLEGGDERELRAIKERELYLFRQSDVITTVSEDEAKLIQAEVPGRKVFAVHHPISGITNMATPFEERQGLLFVGSTHPPNTDAILFYARELMPLLREKIPGITFYAVGGNPDKRVLELNSENLVVTGFVENLLPYFEKCKAFVAPLRYGAGVKGKVIEAMSYGLPVVTTSVGAEGLGVVNGEHMLIADEKEKIVELVCSLYFNKALWNRLSADSRTFVDRSYSQDAFAKKIERVMEHVV
jgi:GT2 family glycosyltransferase